MIANKIQKSVLNSAVKGELSSRVGSQEETIEILKSITEGRYESKTDNFEEPFEIPEEWLWVELREILVAQPKNGYSPRGVGYETSIKNLTLTAVTSGVFFDKNAFKYVDINIEKASNYWLKKDDLLIQRSNSREYVGSCCIYTGEDDAFMYPDLIMRMRVDKRISLKYVDYVLKSPLCRTYYMENASGTSKSMPKINQTIVKSTPIPLPPYEEQIEIVRIIEDSIYKINELRVLESELQELEAAFPSKLKQSMLQDAFGG